IDEECKRYMFQHEICSKTKFIKKNQSSVEDENLKGKISEDDKKKVIDKCREAITWLENNQLAEKEEYEHQLKELEKVCSPIVTKLYQGGTPAGGCGSQARSTSASNSQGPTIEEVD
uniref:Uncharacterized protein n=1 Tax=Paramormyrops kingsleyae TaxID=1676925 RepID=A0A3B3SWC9_9TELE